MATLVRSVLIEEGRIRAGKKGETGIDLTYSFDFILRRMSILCPLLPHSEYPCATVASQSWIALPSDYRSRDQFICDGVELEWLEPEDYDNLLRTGTNAGGASYYTIKEDENRLYVWPTPASVLTCYLYYASVHPKADKSLSFTSGGTHQVVLGDTLTGATSAATLASTYVRVTSGSWSGGDAVGRIVGSVSGTFQAENLNEGANLNVMTIAGDATSADNFQHFFGEKFDEVIIEGLAWKCLERIANTDSEVRLLAKIKKQDFEELLSDYAGVKNKRSSRVPYVDF